MYFAAFSRKGEMNFKNTTINERLDINASATGTDVTIAIGSHLKSAFHLSTSLGTILVEAPATAKVREMKLKTMDGDVLAHLFNTSGLRTLQAETESGNVIMFVEAPFLMENLSLQVRATRNLELDLLVGENVGCEVTAKTDFGNIKVNMRGSNIIEETRQYCLTRSHNYFLADRKLSVTAYTDAGNIEINVET